MANKKVIGELVYQIKGDDSQYSSVINRADQSTEKLTGSIGRNKMSMDGMVTSLAGAYLGWQGVKLAMDATIGSAISYESAFAGVKKTVDGTDEQLAQLSDKFIELSKTMPITAEEFAKIGELAGQLGVPIEQIDTFAKTIAMIGTSTNLSTEQASTDFARFANIMQMPLENVSRLGSTIVELGNNLATTESEIDAMALRLAGAGATLGITEPQVLAWAGALSSVGVEAEAGGSSMSRLMIDISAVASKGGKDLEKFAKVAGMSADDFKKKYKEDANGALLDFFGGLQKVQKGGGDLMSVLNSLGITETRQRDAVLRLTNAGDKLNLSMDLANKGWNDNNALQTEAEKRYKTTESQLKILKNNWGDLARQLGVVVLPIVNLVIKFFLNMADTIGFLKIAVTNGFKAIGDIIALSLIGSVEVLEKFINGAIKLANDFMGKVGIDKKFNEVKLASDDLRNSANYLANDMADLGDSTMNALAKMGGASKIASENNKDLANAQTLLKGSAGGANEEINNLVEGLKGSGTESKKASEEAQKLKDNYNKLKDETEDLSAKGKEALRDLANENVKDLQKIDDKITELKKSLADLSEQLSKDLQTEDKGIAEKIVDEQAKIAELQAQLSEAKAKADDETKKSAQELTDMQEKLAVLQQKRAEQTSKTSASQVTSLTNEIADLQRKIGEAKAGTAGGGEISDLETEIAKRQKALDETKALQEQLSAEIAEATRRAGLTDLQRAVEDYIAKKAQIQADFDQKKKELDDKLALEEQNKLDTIALYEDKQAQINNIITLGNQRFKDLSDNRVKIVEEEVNKQIKYYNQLAQAIANAKSAQTTSELTSAKPKFSIGGYVNSSGGEVHAGEYVIPANMVAKYGGLVKALEGARTGSMNTNTINNNVTMNNSINEQIDMEAVLKGISFELQK